MNQTFTVYPSNTVLKDWIERHPCSSFHTNIYQEVLFFQTQLQEMAKRLTIEVRIRDKALTQRQANWGKWLQKSLNRIQNKLTREWRCRCTQVRSKKTREILKNRAGLMKSLMSHMKVITKGGKWTETGSKKHEATGIKTKAYNSETTTWVANRKQA